MVRLLNGTSFEPGMYGFSSSCFPMQDFNLLARGTFLVLQLAVLGYGINVRSH